MKRDQAELGYVSMLPFLPTYDLIMFFHNNTDPQGKIGFLLLSCSWGFDVRFVRDSGKLLEQPL